MRLSELGQTPLTKAAYSQAALKKFQEGVETDSKAEFPWLGVGIVLAAFFAVKLLDRKKG